MLLHFSIKLRSTYNFNPIISRYIEALSSNQSHLSHPHSFAMFLKKSNPVMFILYLTILLETILSRRKYQGSDYSDIKSSQYTDYTRSSRGNNSTQSLHSSFRRKCFSYKSNYKDQ